jgi:hypothetical protein
MNGSLDVHAERKSGLFIFGTIPAIAIHGDIVPAHTICDMRSDFRVGFEHRSKCATKSWGVIRSNQSADECHVVVRLAAVLGGPNGQVSAEFQPIFAVNALVKHKILR